VGLWSSTKKGYDHYILILKYNFDFIVPKAKTRGWFGSKEIDGLNEELKERPKEKRNIKGLVRRENYIYKTEELEAAEKIAKIWNNRNQKKNNYKTKLKSLILR